MIANRIRPVRIGDGPSFSRYRPPWWDAGFCLQGSDYGRCHRLPASGLTTLGRSYGQFGKLFRV
jgi:hypothetical protein